MKPIEAGCLCIVTFAKSSNLIGTEVTAVCKEVKDDKGQWWSIDDGTLVPVTGQYWQILEHRLMRIDGDPDEEIEVSKELELTQ